MGMRMDLVATNTRYLYRSAYFSRGVVIRVLESSFTDSKFRFCGRLFLVERRQTLQEKYTAS